MAWKYYVLTIFVIQRNYGNLSGSKYKICTYLHMYIQITEYNLNIEYYCEEVWSEYYTYTRYTYVLLYK